MLEVKKVLDYKKPLYEKEDNKDIYAYEICYNCYPSYSGRPYDPGGY
ncbi:hypothetical protein [Senegalia massiliensis]|nr:hypothetical protein [Senegalia massiliensis]